MFEGILFNLDMLKEYEKIRRQHEEKYGHLNDQYIWLMSDNIRSAFMVDIDAVITRLELLKVTKTYSKANKIDVGMNEIDYIIEDLTERGYIKEIKDNNIIFNFFKYNENDNYYIIGDDYKIFLLEKIKQEKNRQLLNIANKINKYTIDFKVTLDDALVEIKNFIKNKK